MAKTTQVLNDERHERHLLRLRGIAESKQEDARRLARYDEATNVLTDLVLRCDGMSGIRSDGSNIPTERAHAFLATEPTEKGSDE